MFIFRDILNSRFANHGQQKEQGEIKVKKNFVTKPI